MRLLLQDRWEDISFCLHVKIFFIFLVIYVEVSKHWEHISVCLDMKIFLFLVI